MQGEAPADRGGTGATGTRAGDLESEGGREGRKEERMGRGRALQEGPGRVVGEVAE